MPETGKQSFQSVLDSLWQTTQIVLRQIAVKEVSKSEAVRQEIENQKVITGKNYLWQAFPWIVGGLVFLAILRFK